MRIEGCDITREDHALGAVAMVADAVGFTFAPSTRQIASGSLVTTPVGCPPAILTGGVF